MGELVIRSVQDSDTDGLIRLVGGVFAEYPGCVLDVDAEMPELRAPGSAARTSNGRWWVAELDGAIVGSVAVVPDNSHSVELKKLYVASRARKRGLGAHLMALVESEAVGRNTSHIFLWSDTRFEDAHRLYERLGYTREPRTRVLNDLSNTVEFHYTKGLAP